MDLTQNAVISETITSYGLVKYFHPFQTKLLNVLWNYIIKEDTAINKDSWAELTSDNYNNFKTFYRNATNNGYTIKSWYVDNTQNIDSINTSNDVSLGNYISYLNDKLGEEDYDYLVIVELSKGIDDNYYYTLKVGESIYN